MSSRAIIRRAILTGVVLALAMNGWSESPESQTPAPNPAVEKLRSLIGSWNGTGSMTVQGGEPTGVDMVMNCHETAGGWAVTCEDRLTAGQMDYRESDLFGFDAETDKVHWYAVTNAGEVHDHVGEWQGSSLVVRYENRIEGKDLLEEITMEVGEAGSIEFHAVTTLGGDTVSALTGSLKRE